ncbi:MAG: hypothetical protein ACTSO2_00355 [Promethearchaeota archaeon]
MEIQSIQLKCASCGFALENYEIDLFNKNKYKLEKLLSEINFPIISWKIYE